MKILSLLFISIISLSWLPKQQVDVIVYHGIVYTVNSKFEIAEAFAIKGGKFVAIGTTEDILDHYSATKMIDARGKAVYPGFIDAHCHFLSYGKMKTEADLVGCNSFEEMVERVVNYSTTYKLRWIHAREKDM